MLFHAARDGRDKTHPETNIAMSAAAMIPPAEPITSTPLRPTSCRSSKTVDNRKLAMLAVSRCARTELTEQHVPSSLLKTRP
jgi:hypothetical protein